MNRTRAGGRSPGQPMAAVRSAIGWVLFMTPAMPKAAASSSCAIQSVTLMAVEPETVVRREGDMAVLAECR